MSTFLLGDGTLRRVAVSEIGPGCSALAVDPARRQIHVAVKGDQPAIVSCRIHGDGRLEQMSRRDVESSLTYLTLTPDGRALLAASYGGGFGISLAVGDSGIGDLVSRIAHPNMHSCAVGPDGTTAYFVSLGADLIAQCALDGAALTPLDPPTVAAPSECGPRHLVLTRDGRHIYVMTEFSGEVLHYRRSPDGILTLAGEAAASVPGRGLRPSRLGADPIAGHLIWGADLHLSLDEKICWASERSESTLATVPIDADGTPRSAERFTPAERQPRGFAVSPDGRYLLCTGEKSTTVSLFRTEPDGGLVFCEQAETGRGANWVRFLSA
ncbi:lactonase family protein [Nakamurella sp.]|uniref:lactonase family protein n=1 Tax=Nakamurella sp. TaxID=1869182 RepID=UPI0037846EFF